VEDDGNGLDATAIAVQAAATGEDVSAQSVERLVFLPGLSTVAPGDLAGRGVGLSAVEFELKAVGYDVEVFSKPGEYARFVLCPRGVSRPENAVDFKEARDHA